jgi:mannosyltransferase OCH1-like enzyme
MIPKKLIQFWHNYPDLPDIYTQAFANNKSQNQDFEILYANDQFVIELLEKKFPACLLALYKANKIAASRSDIARLALLYEFGGVYLDAAIQLNAPLTNFLELQSQVILLKRDDMEKYQDCPEKAHFWNGMIAAVPKSEFIKYCIETQIKNLLSGTYNNDVRAATGPVVINQMIAEKPNYIINALSFKTLKNGLLDHIRIPGLANSWIPLQKNGIINEESLINLKNTYSNVTID